MIGDTTHDLQMANAGLPRWAWLMAPIRGKPEAEALLCGNVAELAAWLRQQAESAPDLRHALVDGGRRALHGRRSGREAAFVVRFMAGPPLNRCGHIPVELDWQPGEFFDHSGLYLICATHGALYAPETGHCLGGRCNGKCPLSCLRTGQIFD